MIRLRQSQKRVFRNRKNEVKRHLFGPVGWALTGHVTVHVLVARGTSGKCRRNGSGRPQCQLIACRVPRVDQGHMLCVRGMMGSVSVRTRSWEFSICVSVNPHWSVFRAQRTVPPLPSQYSTVLAPFTVAFDVL